MKDKLSEIEKEETDKKDDDDAEDEDARKAKEKEKKEEEQENQKLPPDERVKKLRMDVHDNITRLWERAKKSRDDIVGEKAIKSNAQPALNILRAFVDRFVANEIKSLRHDDVKGAEAKFRKFVRQGAEILAVSAMSDVQATLSTVAMHFNYRIVARSGSAEIKQRCAALLEAISDVPARAEAFLKELEDSLAEAGERQKRRKEDKAKAQREREAKGNYSGDAGEAQQGGSEGSKPKAPAANAEAKPTQPKASPAAKKDPFEDFDFGPDAKAQKASTSAVAKKVEHSSVSTTQQPRTGGWDPNFDHPYAGALKSNGTGVYCRPCQRWIVTYEYRLDAFLQHVERVHPKPPPGWKG